MFTLRHTVEVHATPVTTVAPHQRAVTQSVVLEDFDFVLIALLVWYTNLDLTLMRTAGGFCAWFERHSTTHSQSLMFNVVTTSSKSSTIFLRSLR